MDKIPTRQAMKSGRILFLAIGAFLLVWTVQSVGIQPLWIQVQAIGWRVWFVLLFYAAILSLDTWGWYFSFPGRLAQSFRWRSLFGSRLAGEALNYVTPFVALGGEPLKAQILKARHQVSWSDGLASLVVAKTSLVLGLVALILSGLAMALFYSSSSLSNQLKWTFLGITLLLIVLTALFWSLQQVGLARRGWAILRNWTSIGWLKKISLFAGRRLDRKIIDFYQTHRRRFTLSILFHFLGWAFGIVEVYMILRFLGVEISWGQAWILESLLQLVKAVSFVIPASLGAQEGGAFFICANLGLGSTPGLALSMIRRFRDLVWITLGLFLCLWLTKAQDIPQDIPTTTCPP